MGKYTNLSKKGENKLLKKIYNCIPPNRINKNDYNMYFYILDYINDISKNYSGIRFTKDNFEKFRGGSPTL